MVKKTLPFVRFGYELVRLTWVAFPALPPELDPDRPRRSSGPPWSMDAGLALRMRCVVQYWRTCAGDRPTLVVTGAAAALAGHAASTAPTQAASATAPP